MVLKLSPSVVFEVLSEFGSTAAELLDAGKSIFVHEIGVIKPVMLKGREFVNPKTGIRTLSPNRKGVRLDTSTTLRRRFGRLKK
jgi:nucleoid DNA-binding protein